MANVKHCYVLRVAPNVKSQPSSLCCCSHIIGGFHTNMFDWSVFNGPVPFNNNMLWPCRPTIVLLNNFESELCCIQLTQFTLLKMMNCMRCIYALYHFRIAIRTTNDESKYIMEDGRAVMHTGRLPLALNWIRLSLEVVLCGATTFISHFTSVRWWLILIGAYLGGA